MAATLCELQTTLQAGIGHGGGTKTSLIPKLFVIHHQAKLGPELPHPVIREVKVYPPNEEGVLSETSCLTVFSDSHPLK